MFLEWTVGSKRSVWRQWDCCDKQQDKVLSRLEQRILKSGQRKDNTLLDNLDASRVSRWSGLTVVVVGKRCVLLLVSRLRLPRCVRHKFGMLAGLMPVTN